MSNDKTTLADVQPGGRVRLGDQAERARFEAWHREKFKTSWQTGAPTRDMHNGVYADNYGPAEEQVRWEAWQAALSAQPSPGGQDALDCIGRIEEAIEFRVPHDIYAAVHGELAELKAALTARQPVGEAHADDLAVDGFAAAMKAKMAEARAKGRGGWEDPAQCSADDLSRMLRNHVEKGDPRDVANFCMMLHQRGEAISARQPVGELAIDYEDLLDQAKDLIHCGCSVNGAFEWLLEQLTDGEALSAPPAQAVDLGPVRALLQRRIEQWRSHLPADPGAPGTREIETKGEHDYNNDVRIYREGIAVMEEAVALIGQTVQAVDLGDFKALYRAYVRLLESGPDRIIDLGGSCDPVDVMEANDVDLQAARRVLDSQAVGK